MTTTSVSCLCCEPRAHPIMLSAFPAHELPLGPPKKSFALALVVPHNRGDQRRGCYTITFAVAHLCSETAGRDELTWSCRCTHFQVMPPRTSANARAYKWPVPPPPLAARCERLPGAAAPQWLHGRNPLTNASLFSSRGRQHGLFRRIVACVYFRASRDSATRNVTRGSQ